MVRRSVDRRTRGQPLTGLTSLLSVLPLCVLMYRPYCYSPIIQSRCSAGGYDLKPTAESTREDMSHNGVFLVSLGMRDKGYCPNLGQTFIVDPDKVSAHILSVLMCRTS